MKNNSLSANLIKEMRLEKGMNQTEFAKYLSDINMPVWIRHVVVPEINDKKVWLIKLGKFLSTFTTMYATSWFL